MKSRLFYHLSLWSPTGVQKLFPVSPTARGHLPVHATLSFMDRSNGITGYAGWNEPACPRW
ncbi:hypothetical protein [Chitinophaga sp. CB10]|uniref:hypothetical protein n=1 Tax=Chitinophaga sp. CB10 TaxID=1891659 RepID=UPI0025C601D2|nr:hypothetical protein [Chitinophaga sp. CB10]